MSTPWDIYIDERKVKGDRALGFLVVPNTASFLHKLHLCRNIAGAFRPHEVHWSNIRGDCRELAEKWIYRTFQHRGTKFFVERWEDSRTKEYEILSFLDEFVRNKQLSKPYDVVAFLDFDNEHSRSDIQNSIQRTSGIRRCYHLDSRNNDCLQCCDLLLNATIRLRDDPFARQKYPELESQVKSGKRLKSTENKTYLAGYLAQHLDADGSCVYDRTQKID
ncbi:DUF3800 domain-containing protein [Algisphaera agarilytica]|uniref:DUF3800 domain-containing protein n=1 Tax=Algisphaera agarilytica TaxID=1385975 RepID=A0A7X0H3N5_9BACT|nr:hypothetical protein [Algisphaera agarilytica]